MNNSGKGMVEGKEAKEERESLSEESGPVGLVERSVVQSGSVDVSEDRHRRVKVTHFDTKSHRS
jgi:hypothetical protein